MAKRPNPTIGMVDCPLCKTKGAVRQDRSGRIYYICECGGPHPLHGAGGPAWLEKHGELWGAEGTAPEHAPEWIRKGLGFPPGTRSPFSRPRPPKVSDDPVPAEVAPAGDDDDEDRIRGGLFL